MEARCVRMNSAIVLYCLHADLSCFPQATMWKAAQHLTMYCLAARNGSAQQSVPPCCGHSVRHSAIALTNPRSS